MNKTNPKVDWYFDNAKKWQAELKSLRTIALSFPLAEETKWGKPCYMFAESNIVLIHEFKEYCAFLFFKGSLLKDTKGILVQQTENVQAARQIRFTSVGDIKKLTPAVKDYIMQAIDVEKAGLKVELKRTSEFKVPEEFQSELDRSESLKTAFEALTPGRQRAYLLYFASAKQSKTRESRIEKYRDQILDGKGLDD